MIVPTVIAADHVYMAPVLLLVAAVGHSFLWVGIINRTHATGWPERLVQALNKVFFLCMLVPFAVAVWRLPWGDLSSVMPWRIFAASGRTSPGILIGEGYLVLCWAVAAASLVARVRWSFHDVSPVLRFHRRRSLGTDHILHSPDHPHHALVRLPGNESLTLDLTERGLDVPRLPVALDGLSVVHLSDLHFTGKVGKPFFEEVVRMSNALEPEVVAVTGDLVDKTSCIDWVPDTLGRLRARYGVYYILGNHDLRVDHRRLRRVLDACGLVYLGGRWQVVDVRGERVLVAGNELPWFKPRAELRDCPPRSDVAFRFLLAHSPDQLPWARAGDGDLLLAGHNHGGQIRLPLFGPVFAPSWHGAQYASGLFYAPPTILNVSRGLSAELPLRVNCPPEIIHLTLHGMAQEKPTRSCDRVGSGA